MASGKPRVSLVWVFFLVNDRKAVSKLLSVPLAAFQHDFEVSIITATLAQKHKIHLSVS